MLTPLPFSDVGTQDLGSPTKACLFQEGYYIPCFPRGIQSGYQKGSFQPYTKLKKKPCFGPQSPKTAIHFQWKIPSQKFLAIAHWWHLYSLLNQAMCPNNGTRKCLGSPKSEGIKIDPLLRQFSLINEIFITLNMKSLLVDGVFNLQQ